MEVSQKPSNVSISTFQFQLLYLALGMICSLLWIGDTPFINDEPLLLNIALKANEQGDFFTLGLMGTKGLQYGPVPIWFYRALLFVTHNIYVLAFLKTLLVFFANALGIYYFFRLLPRWNFHTAVLIFVSPFLWFYGRSLWDNCLNITLTLWGFVAYFYFFKTRHFGWLSITVFCLAAAFQVHLMSLPFIAAVTIHLIVFNRQFLCQNWKKILLLALCVSFFMKDYVYYLITLPELSSSSHFTGSVRSFFFPFYGGQFFSLHGFYYFLGKRWLAPIPDFFLSLTGWIILLPIYGIFRSFKDCYQKVKIKAQFDFEDHLAFVCLTWFVAFISLSFLKNLRSDPHYYNSAWFLYFVLLNIALNALWNRTWIRKLFYIHGAIMFVSLISIMILLHHRHGTRSLHYGATLENQVEVATELNKYGSTHQWISKAENPHWFPHAINLLRNLEPASLSTAPTQDKSFEILYAEDNVYDGKIVLGP